MLDLDCRLIGLLSINVVINWGMLAEIMVRRYPPKEGIGDI